MITYSMQTASLLLPCFSTALHCICVHCALVDSCKAYHYIEEQHSQPHITPSPTFSPRPGSPRIEAHIHTEGDPLPSYLRTDSSKLDESMDTIEFDVVACEDYQEEIGKWKNSMPKGTLLAAGFSVDWVPR